MSKKKGANNKKGKNAAEDDDWDAILEAEIAANAAINASQAPAGTPAPAPAAPATKVFYISYDVYNVVIMFY
ncbi:hypothetical protein EON64_16500 [archaeon]|nr:MAG: hypothetical protein EON64_16500 [archaeon]